MFSSGAGPIALSAPGASVAGLPGRGAPLAPPARVPAGVRGVGAGVPEPEAVEPPVGRLPAEPSLVGVPVGLPAWEAGGEPAWPVAVPVPAVERLPVAVEAPGPVPVVERWPAREAPGAVPAVERWPAREAPGPVPRVLGSPALAGTPPLLPSLCVPCPLAALALPGRMLGPEVARPAWPRADLAGPPEPPVRELVSLPERRWRPLAAPGVAVADGGEPAGTRRSLR